MEGTFTTFGEPLVKKGYIVHYFDDEHSERNDKRFVADAVTYSYGLGGYRQEITLGAEINNGTNIRYITKNNRWKEGGELCGNC